jgi:hypothetical protein
LQRTVAAFYQKTVQKSIALATRVHVIFLGHAACFFG